MKTIKAKVKGYSSWGGGRVSGGLSYNRSECAWIEWEGQEVRIQFSPLYNVSKEMEAIHQQLVLAIRQAEPIAPKKERTLHSDNWTGATLTAPFWEVEVPEDVARKGVMAQIRATCTGIAHGTHSCRHTISQRYGESLAAKAVEMYPQDFCGYGQVGCLQPERVEELKEFSWWQPENSTWR